MTSFSDLTESLDKIDTATLKQETKWEMERAKLVEFRKKVTIEMLERAYWQKRLRKLVDK